MRRFLRRVCDIFCWVALVAILFTFGFALAYMVLKALNRL